MMMYLAKLYELVCVGIFLYLTFLEIKGLKLEKGGIKKKVFYKPKEFYKSPQQC